VVENLAMARSEYSTLPINHNSQEYSNIVRQIADSFGAEGCSDAARLYQMCDHVNEIFLFTCVEHKFIMAIGLGSFTR
jgi:hypothetical protein